MGNKQEQWGTWYLSILRLCWELTVTDESGGQDKRKALATHYCKDLFKKYMRNYEVSLSPQHFFTKTLYINKTLSLLKNLELCIAA